MTCIGKTKHTRLRGLLLLITSTMREWSAFRSPKLKISLRITHTKRPSLCEKMKFLMLCPITLQLYLSITCGHLTLLTYNQCKNVLILQVSLKYLSLAQYYDHSLVI